MRESHHNYEVVTHEKIGVLTETQSEAMRMTIQLQERMDVSNVHQQEILSFCDLLMNHAEQHAEVQANMLQRQEFLRIAQTRSQQEIYHLKDNVVDGDRRMQHMEHRMAEMLVSIEEMKIRPATSVVDLSVHASMSRASSHHIERSRYPANGLNVVGADGNLPPSPTLSSRSTTSFTADAHDRDQSAHDKEVWANSGGAASRHTGSLMGSARSNQDSFMDRVFTSPDRVTNMGYFQDLIAQSQSLVSPAASVTEERQTTLSLRRDKTHGPM